MSTLNRTVAAAARCARDWLEREAQRSAISFGDERQSLAVDRELPFSGPA